MERKDLTPAIMSFFLFLAIVAPAIVGQWRIPNPWFEYPVNLDTVFASLYALWILVETPVVKRDLSTEGKTTPDFATCQIYAFAQAVTFLSALWFPSVWRAPNVARADAIERVQGILGHHLQM